ncbi:hypothetical protein SBA3_850011 [Candidatus Sulfopaludibacter sp. SbA3]|nr:hypothetical protein SBA3_850011 [Candidatus Sulfopaludibacter sp. SbA3]
MSQTGGTLTIAGPVDPLGVYTLNGGTLNLDDLFTVGTATLSAGTVVDGGGQIVANSLYDAVALDESEIAGGTNLANTPLDSLTLAGGTLSVAPPPSGTPSGIGNEIVNPHEVYVQTSLILGGFLDLTSLTLTNSYPQAGLSPEPYLFPIFETGPAGVSGMFSEVCDASNACYTVTSLSNGAWQIGSFDGWGIRVRPIQFTPGVNGEEVLLVDRTPEPATYLIGGGILGLALLRRRRRG